MWFDITLMPKYNSFSQLGDDLASSWLGDDCVDMEWDGYVLSALKSLVHMYPLGYSLMHRLLFTFFWQV